MLLLLLFTLSVATRLLVTNDVVTNLAIKSIHERLSVHFFILYSNNDDDCLLAMTMTVDNGYDY